MYLGLDISTKTIGVAVFDETKALFKLNHLSLKDTSKNSNENVFLKKRQFEKFLLDNILSLEIEHCFIEEPLFNTGIARSRQTNNLLIGFNMLTSDCVYNTLKIIPKHISVYDARKSFFPEYVRQNIVKGEMKEVFSFPKNLDKKEEVWKKVSSLEPQVKWYYSKTGMLKKENFDMADAYVVGIAGIKSLNRKKL